MKFRFRFTLWQIICLQGLLAMAIAVGVVYYRATVRDRKRKDDAAHMLSIASTGDIKSALVMVENGVDVNAVDMWGCNLLYYAVLAEDVGAVEHLLDNGIAVDQDGKDGVPTPLWQAVSIHNPTIVRILLEHGADPNRLNGTRNAILRQALLGQDKEIVELLIKYGAQHAD